MTMREDHNQVVDHAEEKTKGSTMRNRRTWLGAGASVLIVVGMWLTLGVGLCAGRTGIVAATRLRSPDRVAMIVATGLTTDTAAIHLPLIVDNLSNTLPEKIAFETLRDGNYEIYLMDPDGSDQTNLTNNPAKDVAPAWSPDGRRIAFVSDREGNEEIYVMNRDGTSIVRLTNNPANDGWPTWSPDGARIAFQSDREGGEDPRFDIYVMNADGSGQTRITSDPTHDRWPAWSPDGSRIAFTSNRLGVKKVYVMSPDGSNQTRLSHLDVGYDDRYSTWAPDGRITFVSNRPDPGQSDDSIYIMNANGSRVRMLTDSDAGDWLARWSPDGAQFAFYSDRDGDKNIYSKTLATGAETRLTDNPSDEEYPAWSP